MPKPMQIARRLREWITAWRCMLRQLITELSDIKIFLFLSYAFSYLVAIYPPILIDPHLSFHAQYGARNYPNSWLCGPIYLSMLLVMVIYLRWVASELALYLSSILFVFFIIITIPIFSQQEFPHGNLVFVGSLTTFMALLSIFISSIEIKICLNQDALDTAGEATFDYVKQLSIFARQGAFASVALFSALFFTAFQQDFKYADSMLKNDAPDSERFLVHLNAAIQVMFFTVIAVSGAVRYLFLLNLRMLSQYRYIAARLDKKVLRSEVDEGVETASPSESNALRASSEAKETPVT
ncbi:MAG: hypothetical protein ACLQME_23140 [Alphaproteobacteria bacterium]